MLTKALSALWHCYGKKKYRKSGSKQNKYNKKKQSAAQGGKGQEKGDCFFGCFFSDLDSFVSCNVLSGSLHPEEAVPIHTELVLNKDSISFANAYCQGRECQHRGKHPYPPPPVL